MKFIRIRINNASNSATVDRDPQEDKVTHHWKASDFVINHREHF